MSTATILEITKTRDTYQIRARCNDCGTEVFHGGGDPAKTDIVNISPRESHCCGGQVTLLLDETQGQYVIL